MIFNRESLKQRFFRLPFVPHDIHTSSGKTYRITHPENVFVTQAVLVINVNGEGAVAVIPLAHISSVEQLMGESANS